VIDVNTFIGGYPWRHVPHPEPAVLAQVLQREGLSGAWVGHLPSAFHRDPERGNAELYEALRPFHLTLRPVPTIRPGWPGIDGQLDGAIAEGAPAVRVYPQLVGLGAGDHSLNALGNALRQRALALVFTVRFEDVRQRHPMDVTADLSAAHVREFVRAGSGATVVVTAASREFIEEVHWGLTPAERATVHWDISWLWGPPSDELSHLLRTMGGERFVFGSMWPLRLVQAPVANLQLLEADVVGTTLVDAGTLGLPRSATRGK
jgi:hypothetical protein